MAYTRLRTSGNGLHLHLMADPVPLLLVLLLGVFGVAVILFLYRRK